MSSNYIVPDIEDEVTCWLLAQHPDASIRAYAVASEYADDSVIELLLGDESPMVVQAAIYHPRLPHTPEAASAVRGNDERITAAIAALVPPSRETILWLYQNGGRRAKSAAISLISRDRGLILQALRADAVLEFDARIILNGGAVKVEDHEELSRHALVPVREWVLATTKDMALLERMASDEDTKVAERAQRRIEMLTQAERVEGLF